MDLRDHAAHRRGILQRPRHVPLGEAQPTHVRFLLLGRADQAADLGNGDCFVCHCSAPVPSIQWLELSCFASVLQVVASVRQDLLHLQPTPLRDVFRRLTVFERLKRCFDHVVRV